MYQESPLALFSLIKVGIPVNRGPTRSLDWYCSCGHSLSPFMSQMSRFNVWTVRQPDSKEVHHKQHSRPRHNRVNVCIRISEELLIWEKLLKGKWFERYLDKKISHKLYSWLMSHYFGFWSYKDWHLALVLASTADSSCIKGCDVKRTTRPTNGRKSRLDSN